jgi:hypothetical protein
MNWFDNEDLAIYLFKTIPEDFRIKHQLVNMILAQSGVRIPLGFKDLIEARSL